MGRVVGLDFLQGVGIAEQIALVLQYGLIGQGIQRGGELAVRQPPAHQCQHQTQHLGGGDLFRQVEGSEDGDPHWCHRVDQGGHRGPGEGDPQLDEEDGEEIAHDPHPGKVFPVRPVDLHAEVLPGHEHQGK